MTEDRHELIRCSCGGEVIGLDNWEDDVLSICIFRQAERGGIRNFLRHMWQILRHGHPYLDDIALTKDDAKKVREFISDFIEAKQERG